MWDRLLPALEKTYTVIAIDLLGHGQTGCAGYVHGMELQAAAVLQVLNTEKVAQCLVIGHSMGGYVALALAETQPELMAGLMLFHSTVFADSEDKKTDRERVIGLVQRNQDIYVKAAIPSLFAAANQSVLQEEINGLVQIARNFPKQGIIANIRGMMERKDRSGVLASGKFKKMIVHGPEDSVISNESVSKMEKLDAGIKVRVLSGVGHMGHLEAPEISEQIITDFCSSVYG